ncbi:potassium-transporting ATPase B chain [Escherichia coli]|uniref:Potassium-transporting ATPase B chain n=1 Tax=Escherichia coli TaxID=562 RepID=A0A376LK54_ECOLX|nr:potassium-transporting ATPase B chain [Escherichia coli]
MSRKQLALFEPTLVVQALKEAVKKLNPQAQWRNPVMFIVWIGSLLTTFYLHRNGKRCDAWQCAV